MNHPVSFLFGKISTVLLVVGGLQLALPAMFGQTDTIPSQNSKIAIAAKGASVDQVPRLGAHTLAFHRSGWHFPSLKTSDIVTQPAGSTLLVGVGRGNLSAFSLPRDNKGNIPFRQLGSAHPYTLWNRSGTALYVLPTAAGGTSHIVSTDTSWRDEITMAVVEIANGGLIQDSKWNEALAGRPITSVSVTTTGPAILVAFWWGDAGTAGNKTAQPNNGFVVIDSVLEAGALVQCAVAIKEVATAGTYDVSWTATPPQGAQLWLVAVQHAP